MQKRAFNAEKKSSEITVLGSSLIVRFALIMAIIIGLGLISLIGSMLIAESLSGDAAQINNAGLLRMHAVRVSRAYLSEQDDRAELIERETALLDEKIKNAFLGGVIQTGNQPEIQRQYQIALGLWQEIKRSEKTTDMKVFDDLVDEINKLVTLIQLDSERKLKILRLIQGVGLLAVILVVVFFQFRLNRTLVLPLKQLVNVATEVSKGNFDQKALYNSDDELGVLASTINHMSTELALIYKDLEKRVEQKTIALTQSNRSLEMLYRAARKVATIQKSLSDEEVTSELEVILGVGHITVLNNESSRQPMTDDINVNSKQDISVLLCEREFVYELKRDNKIFGHLIWSVPVVETVYDWQTQFLQAMADILSTGSELEYTRKNQHRFLIMEERAVIARELHDSLAQSLSYLKVQASLLSKKFEMKRSKVEIDETITDLKQGINRAYVQLRELLTTFRLKLEDPSLFKALQGAILEFCAKCQHDIEFDFELPDNYFLANQEIHILQIVREALSNIHRHAEASKAGVSVKKSDNQIILKIWDNGVGFSLAPGSEGHFGLGIMKERCDSLNGELQVISSPDEGTQIFVEFER